MFKCLVTRVTWVGGCWSVYGFVYCQSSSLAESFTTFITFKWFVFGMDIPVKIDNIFNVYSITACY